MKKLKNFVWYVGMISLLFILNACSEEIIQEEGVTSETVEDIASEEEISLTKSDYRSDSEDCGVDWWNDQNGSLTSVLSQLEIEYPIFINDWECCPYAIKDMPYFVFHWYIDYKHDLYDFKGIQVQYRKEAQLGKPEKWVNVGSALKPGYLSYDIPELGIIPIWAYHCPTIVPAYIFAYGNIDIRYRLVTKEWPRPQKIIDWPSYESHDASEILKTASPWKYFFDNGWDFRENWNGFNHYGFDSPTAWDDPNNFIELYVDVSPPNGYDQIDIEVYSMYDAKIERTEEGTYRVFKGWNESGYITVRVNVSKSFSLGSMETAIKWVSYTKDMSWTSVTFDYEDFPHP